MTRYREWLPISDARVRCPKGHVFKPRAVLHSGSMVIGCAQCEARVIVVLTADAAMKLVAEVTALDTVPLQGLSAAGTLVYLLTTPLSEKKSA